MITRTIITAEVKATIVEKKSDGIVSRDDTITLERCTTKEKVEKEIAKRFKNAIVDVKDIMYYADKYIMSEEDYIAHSTLKSHTALTPEEIKAINESRKRGK